MDELRYPVWTLLDTEALGQFPQGIVPITRHEPTMTAMLFFGNPESVSKFIEVIQKPRFNPVALQFPQEVVDAVDHCKTLGATHVVIGFEFMPGQSNPRGSSYEIDAFRAALHKNLRTPGFSAN